MRIVSLFVVLVLAGCAFTGERNPVPKGSVENAVIAGIPDARFWGDQTIKTWVRDVDEGSEDAYHRRNIGIMNREHEYLALSGGSANGAFGAGLLKGWTARGDRPDFELVTGISTGALIAPLAFLGSKYDARLEQAFTTMSTKDIYKSVGLLRWIRSESVVDTGPFRNLVAEVFDEKIIAEIASEHAMGRRLFIGTVNLDAGRPVVWDIGLIASSDMPDKVSLIQQVIVASASIPVAFPPELIEVDVNGKTYDEMHVDGGTASQVFIYPAGLDWGRVMVDLEVQGRPKVYVVRNAYLEPSESSVDRKLRPIAGRSVSTMIRHLGIGDLYHIYALCQRDGLDLNYINIPSDIALKPTEAFDPVYMRALFDRGYEMARTGGFWKKHPPNYEDPY